MKVSLRSQTGKAIIIKYDNEIVLYDKNKLRIPTAVYLAKGDKVYKNCQVIGTLPEYPVTIGVVGIRINKFGMNSTVVFVPEDRAKAWQYIFTFKSKIEAIDVVMSAMDEPDLFYKELLDITFRMAKTANKEYVAALYDKIASMNKPEKKNPPVKKEKSDESKQS